MEQADRSPDENDQQNKDMSRLDDVETGLGYDFEVKEQDRWLPIANGESHFSYSLYLNAPCHLYCPGIPPPKIFTPCVTRQAFDLCASQHLPCM